MGNCKLRRTDTKLALAPLLKDSSRPKSTSRSITITLLSWSAGAIVEPFAFGRRWHARPNK